MKPYFVYKKQFSFSLFSILLTLLVFFLPVYSDAQTAEELNNKINQRNNDITKLEQEIKIYQKQLTELAGQKNSLNSSIKQLDITKKKLGADISITQNKIDKTNYKIQGLSSEIGVKENSINESLDAIAIGIRNINNSELESVTEILLSENDFSEVWNDIDNIITVREKVRNKISELKQIKTELEDTRTDTVSARNELVLLKSQLADQKKIVEQNTAEKNKLLAQTKNSEANYQKLLIDQSAKKEAFEKELRDYESQLKFILDPSKLPGAGVLSWPLDSIFVTQEFGAKTGPHRTYTSGHSGTDFRARTPLPVYAMADGRVLGTGDTDLSCPGVSFGRWIFIEYSNGLSSTYGHLSLIKVFGGKKVRRGEVVGYTGGTGRVTGPHLHVSLYVASAVSVATVPSKSCPGRILKQPIAATNAYLDPMYYLP
ncbi:MAG: peptidoglycan DD-metalloendopeptidase family protein [bacterium]|nr:peptidoglycan DD-metalloendopeptidase family protein [bacterium]